MNFCFVYNAIVCFVAKEHDVIWEKETAGLCCETIEILASMQYTHSSSW